MNGSRRVSRQAGPPSHKPKPTPPRVGEAREQSNKTRTGSAVGGSAGVPQSDSERSTGATEAAEATAARPGRGRRRRRKRSAPRAADRVIVFVGPMAAGKTSLGKRVARELGVPFVDSDAVFVRAHGAITEFFANHGESEFRRIEAEVIAKELVSGGGKVLALGGGAVLTPSTRELLSAHPVVLLMTTQEAVLRTANLARRPLLRDDPNAWGRILKERRPLYEEVADVTYRTDRATQEQLTRRVANWARSYRGRR